MEFIFSALTTWVLQDYVCNFETVYMKPLISLCVGIFFTLSVSAQELISETRFANIYEFEKVVTETEHETNLWDINDSLLYIPAYDTYCSWNSKRVHPYAYNLTNMKDTVFIPLAFDTCSFVAPFIGRKTSDFGARRYRHHYGVDIKVYVGDPISSAFEGVVRVAHYDRDYGKVVVVRHTNGLETLYAHLSELKVREGDWIEAGDIVGLGGNTGRSTGSHLHFEVRYKGEPINPNDIIDWETGTLLSDNLLLNKQHFAYLKEIRKIKYHTIRSGDTLSGIARKHGTTVSALCKLNGIRSNTTLRVGRTLRYN